MAAAEGHIEMIEYLITQTKFDFDETDRWGRDPVEEMSHKVSREEKLRIKKLIKEHRK